MLRAGYGVCEFWCTITRVGVGYGFDMSEIVGFALGLKDLC